MQPINVAIAQGDCVVAETLASSLHGFFRNVAVARTPEELRTLIKRQPADVAIVDLELMNVNDVESLCHEFANVSVVATHRIPDDSMWSSALSAGAVDCCDQHDVRNIVRAISRSTPPRHRFAHAA